MLDPEVLDRALTHLKDEIALTCTIHKKDDLGDVFDLLEALRDGNAQIVYKCRTHETPRECEAVNLQDYHFWLLRNDQEWVEADPEGSVERYMTVSPTHADCHS